MSRLLVEAFALVREAGRRTIGMRHFDVQLLGGIAMFHRSIVEMQTGEGKTLAATLAAVPARPAGRGCHLATVNDYLARRDAEWMRPIYEALGMSVGVIETQMPQPQRRKAYACDVTYGTAKEFGFDFLRDRLLLRRIGEGQTDLLGGMLAKGPAAADEKPVQGEPYFALVDEADSILDRRGPHAADYRRSADRGATPGRRVLQVGRVGHRTVRRRRRLRVRPREEDGRTDPRGPPKSPHAAQAAGDGHRRHGDTSTNTSSGRFWWIASTICDRQYVVRDGEIVIVDEFTGRLAEGRKWRDGIHQAVEAKEGVEVTVETGQAARITVQDFFLRYEHLAGMTGTAMGSARELRRIYRCHVVPIPTNRPAIRQRLPNRVFGAADAKWAAVVEEICQLHAAGPAGAGRHPLDRQVGATLQAARCAGHRTPGAQRQPHRRRGRHRRRRRRDGQSHRLDQHGRSGNRHQAGRRRGRAGRAARHLHRDARRQPHRPAA